ncbi:kinesin-like protein KIF6 [Lampris incognitus]|uniref:kinesin-like protein KIF6 n=1 Tax=Lampris incognitus TaxID=2546036 RepID=UPI0024B5D784|nr:kinesin-like protein KIF6 [Lampris incognitus]
MVKQTIQIFARVKPTKKTSAVYSVDNEEQTGASLEFVVPKDLTDGFINNKKENYKFRFQKVFDQIVKQEEIFETIAKPVADSVLAGYNGTIFAYGQTGSGKTFVITGGAEHYSDRGIIPRTLSYIYQRFSQDSSMVYTTHISYLEIYNEVGYDLLDPRHEASNLEDLPKVTIMEDPDQNIHLRNLSLQQAANEEEALSLLFLGDTNRVIAETPMNQASTRSHCIFTVHLCTREPGSATLRRSKLHLVDLAGSERVGKTGVGGQLLTEAKYINLSLHYLEQVIIALSEKNRSHIPYRNSMMTSVLRDSLGGNCMTTMIATISVDKRNLEESISTCRFAQRVALIKNEAVMNEELDPALLIAGLRREIQSLKEELSMVTGEQRGDRLTEEEIQKLEELVKAFLDDPDPEVTLALGPDLRKINHCFSLLKAMIRERLASCHGRGGGQVSPSGAVRQTENQDSPRPADVSKLKEMLAQRDNEMSVLVGMLKKEKKRTQDALAHLASIPNSHSLPSQCALSSSAVSPTKDENTNSLPDNQGRTTTLYRKRGPLMSLGKREAFEIFRRDHEDSLTIEDNKAVLKQRFAEAKALGEQVNMARTKVNELKKQLEIRRRQKAAHGIMGNYTEVEKTDGVEENLCKQIEEEKKTYKSTFGCLKALRTEIEHLQLLLERAKLKLQKDFQQWWNQETCGLQVSESEATFTCTPAWPSQNLRLPSPGTQGNGTPSGNTVVRDLSIRRDADQEVSPPSAHDLRSFVPRSLPTWTTVDMPPDRKEATAFTPLSEMSMLCVHFRPLSNSELSSSSIPLTGDQQTDADILAFVRARQNLLTRTVKEDSSQVTWSGNSGGAGKPSRQLFGNLIRGDPC